MNQRRKNVIPSFHKYEELVGFYRKFAAVRSANPSLKALLYPK
jgi:hypothetical protein